ncbi:hypothetical protein BJ741DRAFT_615045 [Chytriomyces cf. hyalinus JEL632]|nr:hypothetical protein BJ741DRAFT_615045 [Chytriomyces cf. hyalinus JEL632]
MASATATTAATTTTATWSDSSTLLTDSEDETPLSEIERRLRTSRISVTHRDSHGKRVSFIARESDSHSPTAPSPTTVQLPAHKLRRPIQSSLKKHNSCIQLYGKSASVSTLRLATSKSVSVSASIPVYRSASDPLDHIPIAMLASASVQQRRLSFAVNEPCPNVDDIIRASNESSTAPVILPRHNEAVTSHTPVRSFSLPRLPPAVESRPEVGSMFKHRSHSFLSLRKPFSKASVKGTANRVTDTSFSQDEFTAATGNMKFAAHELKHVIPAVDRAEISNRSSSVSLNAKKRWSWAWARK